MKYDTNLDCLIPFIKYIYIYGSYEGKNSRQRIQKKQISPQQQWIFGNGSFYLIFLRPGVHLKVLHGRNSVSLYRRIYIVIKRKDKYKRKNVECNHILIFFSSPPWPGHCPPPQKKIGHANPLTIFFGRLCRWIAKLPWFHFQSRFRKDQNFSFYNMQLLFYLLTYFYSMSLDMPYIYFFYRINLDCNNF